MVRIFGFIIGLGFAGVLLISLVVNLVGYFQAPPEPTAEHEFHRNPKELSLKSNGPSNSKWAVCFGCSWKRASTVGCGGSFRY